MKAPLHLDHRYSVLRFHLEGFFPVTNMKCLSLSLLIDFSLKSILLDSYTTCFLGPFHLNIFSNFLSDMMSVFEVEVSFLYAEKGWILFSYPIC